MLEEVRSAVTTVVVELDACDEVVPAITASVVVVTDVAGDWDTFTGAADEVTVSGTVDSSIVVSMFCVLSGYLCYL